MWRMSGSYDRHSRVGDLDNTGSTIGNKMGELKLTLLTELPVFELLSGVPHEGNPGVLVGTYIGGHE